MVSAYFRPVVLITALISLAQSIAWFVMSLLGVLAYRCNLVPADDADNNSRFIYFLYFQGPDCMLANPGSEWTTLADVVWANPLVLHGWMCAYLTFDITYFVISIFLLVELCRAQDGTFSLTLIRLWVLNTLTFLIMDLWLTIIFGLDFQKIQNFLSEHSQTAGYGWMASVPGALMAVSARGFILWVINFALFCYFLRASFNWSALCNNSCCQTRQKSVSQQHLHRSHTDPNLMYSTDSIPRVAAEWDNGQVLVPVKWHQQQRQAAVDEGVTAFNEPWNPRQKYYDEEVRQDNRSLGRSRATTPPPRRPPQDPMFPSGNARPANVRSVFEYPDRRNFEQGGKSAGARPLAAAARNNDVFY